MKKTSQADDLEIQRRTKKLIKETLNGKSRAFAELVSMNENRIKAVGMSFFHNTEDTEDFVQEVFLKAYTNLSSFRGDSKFSTWLTRIAYTTAINEKTRRKEYETLADETILPDTDKTPEENHIRKITKQTVREAIKELPEKYAFCLDLYFFYDNAYDEIAIITGLPINTIKSHIFRAKKILREKLCDFTETE